MKTITITTDNDTAQQILSALEEAEDFGQITGTFDTHVSDHDDYS